jgi:hypothetical protein
VWLCRIAENCSGVSGARPPYSALPSGWRHRLRPSSSPWSPPRPNLDGAAAGEFKAYIDGMRAGDRLEDVLSTREASQLYASAVEAYSPKLLDAGTRSSWC